MVDWLLPENFPVFMLTDSMVTHLVCTERVYLNDHGMPQSIKI